MPRLADPNAHEALVEAARAEFARAGLERARVEDVARRAGVSKGAFYLHFRTKEDAFREILARFLGVLEEQARKRHEQECRFEEAWARAGRGPPKVEDAIDFECRIDVELLEILWRNRQILAALDAAGGKPATAAGEFRRRMRALVGGRLASRQVAARLRDDVDPGVVADLVLGAYEGLGRRMAGMKEKPDLARWARSLLVVLYQGMPDRPVAQGVPAPVSPERSAGSGRRRPARRRKGY